MNKKSFEEVYEDIQNNSNDVIEMAEAAKKERRKQNLITLLLCIGIDAGIIYYLTSKFEIGLESIPICIIGCAFVDLITFAIVALSLGKKQKEFRKMYKEQIIKKVIDNFYDNLEYFPERGIAQNIYNEGKYMEGYNRYFSDDYIEAKIDNKFLINLAEVCTQREETHTDSDGDTHTTTYTIFHGLFAKIVIEKSINTNLRITPGTKISVYKERLEMDSSEFEKNFNVYTPNKITGMQILTADIMEEILEFKNKTKNAFDIFIDQNIIYLRFSCGSMFEKTKIKNGKFDEKSLREYYNILDFIYELTNKIIRIIDETDI